MENPETQYRRTFEELERVASKFWPTDISEIEAGLSIIPRLLETQDVFIGILSTGAPTIDRLFTIVEASGLPSNLFVKHLVILADFGGEMLQRVSREFKLLFPTAEIHFSWLGHEHSYAFKALRTAKLSNKSLRIDGKELLKDSPLTDLQKDAIVLLLFGKAYSDEFPIAAAALSKCEIGDYLGSPSELEKFIKQRYIWVSRVTGGAQSNSLGQIAQRYVAKFVQDHLNVPNVEIKPGGRLPGVTHTDDEMGRLTSFDLVVTNSSKYVAIEVSFQVTTNSVIERKAGQARSRFEQIEQAGHKIAYVLDGAGNFQRETALRTICAYSHCTVAFSQDELHVLCDFIREYFGEHA